MLNELLKAMFDEYRALPPGDPFNEIIKDPYNLRSRLNTFTNEAYKKLYLLDLKAYIKLYVRNSDGRLQVTSTEDGIQHFEVGGLLDSIEAELQLCEERIRLGGLRSSPLSSPIQTEADRPEEVDNIKPGLYGSPREVARFMVAAEKAGLLPRSLSTNKIAVLFEVNPVSYETEYRKLRGVNYTPPKLKMAQPFIKEWLMNMNNDDLESIILIIRKLQA